MSGLGPTRRFYRVVTHNPPTRFDFLSAAARGRSMRRSTPPELARLWNGLSISSTIEMARYTALRFPRSGSFIATIEILDDGRFQIEQTTDTPTHYTIWGDPDELLATVIAVAAV